MEVKSPLRGAPKASREPPRTPQICPEMTVWRGIAPYAGASRNPSASSTMDAVTNRPHCSPNG